MRVLLACPRFIAGGNKTYFLKLIDSLGLIDGCDLHVIINRKNHFKGLSGCKTYLYDGSILGEAFFVKKIERAIDPDVVHFTNTLIPVFYKKGEAKLVATIHDLNFLEVSQGFFKNLYKKILYRLANKNSDALIFISKFTKGVYQNYIGEVAPRSKVIYEGCEYVGGGHGDRGQEKYIMSFAHRPHKNVEASFNILRLLNEVSSFSYKLLVVGAYDYDEVSSSARKVGVESCVEIYQSVSDVELYDFYSKSLALIFLSKYEGFGLPVLEAMSCGCAVITHDLCSLSEVGGDAAFYVKDDGSGYLEGAEIIKRLESDVKFRSEVALKSRNWASRFSWAAVAASTYNFYSS